MARSLEGKSFFRNYNNGVYSLASEEVFRGREKAERILNHLCLAEEVEVLELPLPASPIFTFAHYDRVLESPWFTGHAECLRKLIEHICEAGGSVLDSGLHVPFSNGVEKGRFDRAAQLAELRYVTSERQFAETFGITINEIHRRRTPRD